MSLLLSALLQRPFPRKSTGGTQAILMLPPQLANFSPLCLHPMARPSLETSSLGSVFQSEGAVTNASAGSALQVFLEEGEAEFRLKAMAAFCSVPAEVKVGAPPQMRVAVDPNTLLLPPGWARKG